MTLPVQPPVITKAHVTVLSPHVCELMDELVNGLTSFVTSTSNHSIMILPQSVSFGMSSNMRNSTTQGHKKSHKKETNVIKTTQHKIAGSGLYGGKHVLADTGRSRPLGHLAGASENSRNLDFLSHNKRFVVGEYLKGLGDVSAATPVDLDTADLVDVNATFLLQLVLLLKKRETQNILISSSYKP
ncbi:hypothetical protein E2C01_011086 [Portunus trituberculatus]|uniref:Uncharacterized protein n=1 Tax=Portunus trituberculatus TaxID=210409 RepID=A0A5B7DAD1_PORTR|nr:hypothetical protein [Portunus trituberculatus]